MKKKLDIKGPFRGVLHIFLKKGNAKKCSMSAMCLSTCYNLKIEVKIAVKCVSSLLYIAQKKWTSGCLKHFLDLQNYLSLSQNLSACEQAGTGNPTLTTAIEGKCVKCKACYLPVNTAVLPRALTETSDKNPARFT